LKKKLYIKTYGCQMNVYDSERMADLLSPLGYALGDSPEGADLVILNTCHVREKATEKAYSDLGRVKEHKEIYEKSGEQMLIAVAGCTAQAEGDEILRRAPYVDMVVGPQSYQNLPQLIAEAKRRRDGSKSAGRGILDIDFPEVPKFDNLPSIQHAGGPAAFLAIQEGCDKFCHFCIVPYTRGAEYSRPVQDVLKDAKDLVRQGVKEITLLGQNVNAYHGQSPRGSSDWHLGELITAVAEIDGLERIRYTTSHPRDVDDTLIQAHKDVDKLMPHLHLPVQSGSDRMLNAMNRKHTVGFYKDILERFRESRPDIAFSSDFIVGYPGESEQDFEETLDLVRFVHYAQSYSFKYSPRPGTPASVQEAQVPEEVKDERLQRLQGLIRIQQEAFNQACAGRRLPVLFDRIGRKEGQIIGRSPYLQSVYVEAPNRLLGQIVDVDITHGHLNSLTGAVAIEDTSLILNASTFNHTHNERGKTLS
jgi:tRNA-2-methylthio-N6-dimethylallyladenosine synthase